MERRGDGCAEMEFRAAQSPGVELTAHTPRIAPSWSSHAPFCVILLLFLRHHFTPSFLSPSSSLLSPLSSVPHFLNLSFPLPTSLFHPLFWPLDYEARSTPCLCLRANILQTNRSTERAPSSTFSPGEPVYAACHLKQLPANTQRDRGRQAARGDS